MLFNQKYLRIFPKGNKQINENKTKQNRSNTIMTVSKYND